MKNGPVIDESWVAFPGGELEGRRPRGMCRACRDRVNQAGTLCFQCYRDGLERDRALKAAATLDTASEARFQTALPFEPVNRARLAQLRVERATSRRAAMQTRQGPFTDRIHRAQIAARQALQRIVASAGSRDTARVALVLDAVTHAAELQLPESWLPFVVARHG